MKLKALRRPAGKSADYRFFVNEDTGHRFKAKVLEAGAGVILLPDEVRTAPAQPAVTITVSPIGEDNSALRWRDAPVLAPPASHTFTEAQMSDPAFDPDATILGLIEERIAAAEALVAAQKKIDAFHGRWRDDVDRQPTEEADAGIRRAGGRQAGA